MSDQAIVTEVVGTPATATAPIVTKAVGSTTGESFAPKKAEGQPVAAPGEAKPKPTRPTKLSMSQQDLNERIKRARTSAFKEAFGTENVDEIRQKLARAEALEQEAEKARVARMSEIERAKHEADRAKKEAEQYRAEIASMRDREVVRDQQSLVERLASRHVNTLYMDEATNAFAREVAKADPREVAEWTERDISRWFAQYVAKKPAFATKSSQQAAPAAPRRVEKVKVSSPTPPPRPQRPGTAAVETKSSKTFKPGQPNSMSREEARAEARRLGYHW